MGISNIPTTIFFNIAPNFFNISFLSPHFSFGTINNKNNKKIT